jgi:hypothetical protein
MHLLIDADSLMYKAAAVCDTKMYVVSNAEGEEVSACQYKKELMKAMESAGEDWTWEHLVVETEPVANALHNLKVKLQLILDESLCDTYELFLTKGDNFRHRLAKNLPYKGTRGEKPTHIPACFEYLMKHWGATYTDDLEADDVVAMRLLEHPKNVVAHIDKDIDTVEGRHFNFDRYEFYYITPEEALCNFYRQFLVGDSSDNIAGVRGIGKVTSSKLIKPTMTEMQMFKVICRKFNDDFDLILETGRLLHMTRALHPDGSAVFWRFPTDSDS